jgi:hypothetical protein
MAYEDYVDPNKNQVTGDFGKFVNGTFKPATPATPEQTSAYNQGMAISNSNIDSSILDMNDPMNRLLTMTDSQRPADWKDQIDSLYSSMYSPSGALNYDPWEDSSITYGYAPLQSYWQDFVKQNPSLFKNWTRPESTDVPFGPDMMFQMMDLPYYETRNSGRLDDQQLIAKLQRGKPSIWRTERQFYAPHDWVQNYNVEYGLDETGGLKEISNKWDSKDIRSRGFVERAIGREGEKWVGNLLTMGATAGFDQIPKAYSTYKETGDWAQGLDRMVDPAGTIDYTTRDTGDFINKEVPELTPYVQPVATAVGTIIYPGAGTAIGSGIGAKLAGGTTNKDYSGDFINAGASYVGGAAGGTLGNAVGSAIGGTTGTIAGGATTGAVAGAAGQVPAAVETGDWSGVGTGALIGGLAGGLQAGGSALYNGLTTPAGGPSPAYEDYISNSGRLSPPNQTLYDAASAELGSGGISFAGDNTMFQVDPSLVSYTSTDPLLFGGGATTFPTDTSSFQAPSPSRFPSYNPLAPEWPTYNMAPELSPIQLDPELLPGLNKPELFSTDSIRKALGDVTEGYDPNFVKTLTGGDDNIQGWHFNESGDFVPPSPFQMAPDLPLLTVDPTLKYMPGLNPITDYVFGQGGTETGFDWDKLLDALGGLGGTQAAVPGGFPTGREFNGDDSAYVEPPMKSGKGSGSKGLTAEEYEKLYNGTSFMPDTKEIERFNKQGLYYT